MLCYISSHDAALLITVTFVCLSGDRLIKPAALCTSSRSSSGSGDADNAKPTPRCAARDASAARSHFCISNLSIPTRFINIIIVYYAIRQQHTIYTVKYNKSRIKTSKIYQKSIRKKLLLQHRLQWHCKTFHTADLTDTLYELISYFEPIATNVLPFNTDKVLSTALSEQCVFCQNSSRFWSIRYDSGRTLQ